MPEGFTLGDHTFLHPDEEDPMDPLARMDLPPKQILGGSPPDVFVGFTRDADIETSVCQIMLDPPFMGHGEPTIKFLDVVIDGSPDIEVAVMQNDDDPDELIPERVFARKPGNPGSMVVLFDSTWAKNQVTLVGVEPSAITNEQRELLSDEEAWFPCRVTFGLEYPSETDSHNCVSWITMYAWEPGTDQTGCMVDAELA